MKVTDMVNNERLKEYYDMQEVERFLPILQNDYLNIQKQIDGRKSLKKETVSENLERLNDKIMTIKANLTQV